LFRTQESRIGDLSGQSGLFHQLAGFAPLIDIAALAPTSDSLSAFVKIVPLHQFTSLVSAMLGAEDFTREVAGEMGS